MMAGVNTSSAAVARRIPPDSVGAELGVWRGDTSALFLTTRKVKHLHLVDTWSVGPYTSVADFYTRYAHIVGGATPEVFQAYYDRVHAAVANRFAEAPVTIHRVTTQEFLADAPKLDWVYVDASHEYEDVLRDLQACAAIVPLIFGDDYGNKPGVVQAVDEFAAANDSWTLEVFAKNQFQLTRGA